MATNDVISAGSFLNVFGHMMSDEQKYAYEWFVRVYNIAYIRKDPCIKRGVLSQKRIMKHCNCRETHNMEKFNVLFTTPVLTRNIKSERSILALHCSLTNGEVLDLIGSWNELKWYLVSNNLIMDIYDGIKYGFMPPYHNTLAVMYPKFDNIMYYPYECLRLYSNDNRIIERMTICPEISSVSDSVRPGNLLIHTMDTHISNKAKTYYDKQLKPSYRFAG